MKTIKLLFGLSAAVLLCLGFGTTALAFHDEGVAHCDGCHTMHNSQDGDPITTTPGDFLLKGSDPSSTCLACHASAGQFAGGFGYGSGGDYYWVTKTFNWITRNRPQTSTGDSHGHNIIAMDFQGLESDDAELGLIPPGDTGPLPAQLACTSCHDPHGRQGNPLLLWGVGDTRGGKTFVNDAPVIESPGRSTTETRSPVSDTEHSAFGSGMSPWCANCHTNFIEADKMHPVDQGLGSRIADNYNKYVSTDVIDPSNGPNSYWEHVPFETNEAQDALDINRTAGPDGSSQVMCLSCHRAHASAFPDIGRWYFAATFINQESRPLGASPPPGEDPDDGSVDDVNNKYYGKPWTDEQRSLCNKCHIND
jgi:hypothetical protein